MKYVIYDNYNEGDGQTITLSQGELRNVVILFMLDNFTPRSIAGCDECVVKIYTGVSSSPIEKKLSLTTVTLLQQDLIAIFGVTFQLTAVDSAAIAANTAGVPVEIIFSTADVVSDVINLQAPIIVLAPVI